MRIKIKIRNKTKNRVARRSAGCQGNWTRPWMAMGTFAAYSFIGSQSFAPVWAQNSQATTSSVQIRNNQPARRFDIPAGPLDAVLAAFRKAAEINVTVPNQGILSLMSPGVSGAYTPEQALVRLLSDTGLEYRFTAENEVTVQLKAVSSSVSVVTSVEALAMSSPKYTMPILDTPQTINTVTHEVMQQQGTTTLRDALRNVAGISIAAGEGGAQGDNLTIRGFAARNDLFIDGMRDFGSYYRDPFNTQEVQVLQGPTSVTFGRGSTGGVVNQSTKIPALAKLFSADVSVGTDLTRRGTVDFETPVPKLGKGTAFRLNLMGNQNKIAGRDIAENRRWGIAPSLSFGLGTMTRASLSFVHQFADDTPDYGIPWLFNQAAPVNRRNYYGFKDANHLTTQADIGTAKIEHDFNSRFTIRDQFRNSNYHRDVLITEARPLGTITLATPLASIQVSRNQLGAVSDETFLDNQTDLTARFRTAFIQHTLVTGVEISRETADPTRPSWSNVPTASLLAPNTSTPFSGTSVVATRVQTTAVSASAYALDTLHFGSHFDLTGGIRLDRFDADYQQFIAPVAAFKRLDRMASWRVAAVYKPIPAGSIYVAAGTSFNPSAEALALSAATVGLAPEKNLTYEAGTKWDLPRNRLSLRAAIFRTEKQNARETDPTNSLLTVLSGTQRVNGVQLEVRGRVNRRVDILSSYAYLDATLVASRFFPAAVGARLANVPAHTFTFWSNARLPMRFEGGLGTNFVSSRNASSTVPLDPTTGLVKQVPGYWVFNAMLQRRISEHITLQANVYNIANRYYYDQLHPGHLVLGPGRSALIGIKFKF